MVTMPLGKAKGMKHTKSLLTACAIPEMVRALEFYRTQGIDTTEVIRAYLELSSQPDAGKAECLIGKPSKVCMGYWPGLSNDELDNLSKLSYTIYKLCYQLHSGKVPVEGKAEKGN